MIRSYLRASRRGRLKVETCEAKGGYLLKKRTHKGFMLLGDFKNKIITNELA